MPAELLDDPHLEASGLPDWTLAAGATIVSAGRSGQGIQLSSIKTDIVTLAGSALQTGLTLKSGWTLSPEIWAKLVTSDGNDADLRVRVDNGSGSFTNHTVTAASVTTTDWFLVSAPDLTAAGSAGRFRVDVTTRSVSGTTVWRVDDFSLLAMAKTIALRDAAVLDLKDITTANGFATNVDSNHVYTEPVPLAQRASPSVFLRPEEGGEADPETLTNRVGDTLQRFSFEALVQSSTPHTDAANFLDDIRNACERTSSNLNGEANVDAVTVTEWSSVVTSSDIAVDHGIVSGQIEVRYTYTRGSV